MMLRKLFRKKTELPLSLDTQTILRNTVASVRSHYLEFYLKCIAAYATESNRYVLEVKIQVNDREHFPVPYQMHVIDLFGILPDQKNDLVDCSSEYYIEFDPIECMIENTTRLSVHSFMWNAVEFKCETIDPNSEAILNWASKWLEEREKDENGLSSMIHSIQYEESSNGNIVFSVDMGSAPVDCFFELIKLFSELGLKEISVSSNGMIAS